MIENWPVCGREVHLHGGLLAISEPQSDIVRIWPNTLSGKSCEITIPTYGKIYTAVKQIGLKVVGVEFITHESEAIGSSPTQWRSYSAQEQIWPNWDASQLWHQLGNASYKHKNGFCYDLSKRISYQLTSLNIRLRDLSLSYRDQLNALDIRSKPKHGQRFQDGFTDVVYYRFHSFLFDACILRDYLSEFIYHFSNGGALKEAGKEIATAGGLHKSLKKSNQLSPFEQRLKECMDDCGWLKELGDYRDLVMHSAPINISNHQLYCIQEIIALPDCQEIQSVRFPIPSDPAGLYKIRCKRDDFDKYVSDLDLIAKAALDDYGKYDCLEYAQTISTKLSCLALECITFAPYRPMVQQFIRTDTGIVCSYRQV
ncbi:hypothetical protein WH43_04340 [Rheinheimera sp. KL1]|uniref:hypothetical protein n=1 Tax=Rheinheimera sp. KL1 TaxID=1635005 RepID=UPI0006A9C3FF|nr:hypothetical protein [Rheinheimera sp. KL1]KOO59218.1 hypothetical protein WH43_04340 [Rheinheimera sp. KL1]